MDYKVTLSSGMPISFQGVELLQVKLRVCLIGCTHIAQQMSVLHKQLKLFLPSAIVLLINQ
ncbi:MAG: hypothetical protein EAY76_01295 [Alphaproteobacteria bacterium]|nr:MAG: hypothetical protein EAY76_01295 [Alphaproteobacteria bacterium]